MRDFFRNELVLGDIVAFYAPGYREYTTGTIIAFTAQKVRVSYVNTWNYGKPGLTLEYLCYPSMLIKRPNTARAEAALGALRQVVSHYPPGINPFLDDAVREARGILDKGTVDYVERMWAN